MRTGRRRSRLRILLLPLLAATGFGCAFLARPDPPEPVRFEATPQPWLGVADEERFPNWPTWPWLGPEQARRFTDGGATILGIERRVGGTTGARKVEFGTPLSASGRLTMKVKPVPALLDGINNAPRKELAAYAIQPLFLEPEDYVVPTTLAFCIPVAEWAAHHGSASPSFRGSECLLVVGAFWLEDVTLPAPLVDRERFLEDPTYAYFLSNFNLLTYLVDHRDGREGNFLISKDDSRRQVFSVDNGSSFDPVAWNYFVPNWNHIRVPALRRDSIERLRDVDCDELEDRLLVVAQLELGDDGLYHNVRPGEPIDDDKGAQHEDGVIQFGLTEDEVEDLCDRIEDLVEAVDDGELPVF